MAPKKLVVIPGLGIYQFFAKDTVLPEIDLKQGSIYGFNFVECSKVWLETLKDAHLELIRSNREPMLHPPIVLHPAQIASLKEEIHCYYPRSRALKT